MPKKLVDLLKSSISAGLALTCLFAAFPVAPLEAATVIRVPSTPEEIALARDIQLYKEILELDPSESLILDAWYTFVQKYPDIAKDVHYKDIDTLERKAFGKTAPSAPPGQINSGKVLDGLLGDWILRWRGGKTHFSLDKIRPDKSLDYSMYDGLNFGRISCRDYKAVLEKDAIRISVRCKSRRFPDALSAPDRYTIQLNFEDGRFTQGKAYGGRGLNVPVEILPDN